MDSLTTVLAGIVVLALPFVVWFKFAVLARRERELDEIKNLVTERSQWLDELHSRLDALDKQDSQHDSARSEEVALRKLPLLAYQTAISRNVDWEILIADKALGVEVVRAAYLNVHLHEGMADKVYWTQHLRPEESETDLDWRKAAELASPVGGVDVRRKISLRRMGREALRGPAPQPL